MVDESTIHRLARAAIWAGSLPDILPYLSWGGRGTGAICAICREAVHDHEVELELEFLVGDTSQPTVNHPVHLQCFAAWEIERQSRVADASPPPGNGHLPAEGNGLRLSERELDSPAAGRGRR